MTSHHFSKRQRGLSLPFALVSLVGLGLTGVSMMRSTDATTMIAGNIGFRETASKATELGLEAGIANLSTMTTAQRLSDLSASNYYASLESVNTFPTTARLSASLPAINAIADTTTGNSVRYIIERMCQSSGSINPATCVMDAAGTNSQYRITAMTIGPRNASQTTQMIVNLDEPTPNCSMMLQGAVVVSGEQTQNGSSKCYHSNTSISMSGQVTHNGILATAATGSASYTGGGSFSAATQSNQSPRTLPAVVPADHKSYATHIFRNNGTITTLTGAVVPAVTDWEWKPADTPPRWILNDDKDSVCPPTGRYYFETNVFIPKKIGSSGLTCDLSIISDQSIMVSGGPMYMRNYRGALPTGTPAATQNIFMMAGGDIELPGESYLYDTNKSAMILTKAELKVNGAVTLEGALVARNELAAPGSADLTSINTVSGTVIQTYNGGGVTAASAITKRKSWRFVSR